MDRFLKLQNIAFAVLFGAMGVLALVAAICGNPHQFTMGAICATMVALAITEIRREKRKARRHAKQ